MGKIGCEFKIMKHGINMKKILFIACYLILSACDKEAQVEPEKHPNIPNAAFWQGGPDGGAWYNCKHNKKEFEYKCSIYSDITGEIIMVDDFEVYLSLYNNGDVVELPISDFKNKELSKLNINSFDGQSKISMQGVLIMKAKNNYEK